MVCGHKYYVLLPQPVLQGGPLTPKQPEENLAYSTKDLDTLKNAFDILETYIDPADHHGEDIAHAWQALIEARAVLENQRPDTGVMQFGDDWPGVFFRGKHALTSAFYIEQVLDGDTNPIIVNCVKGHINQLRACQVKAKEDNGQT